MIWQRFYNLMFSLSFAAAVLFAQICNVVCLASNCTNESQVVITQTPKSSSHCHNVEPPASQESEPKDDTHNCQTHDLTLLLAAAETKSAGTAHLDWQLVTLLPTRYELVFWPPPTTRVRLSALRSPPRIPQRLILRI